MSDNDKSRFHVTLTFGVQATCERDAYDRVDQFLPPALNKEIDIVDTHTDPAPE